MEFITKNPELDNAGGDELSEEDELRADVERLTDQLSKVYQLSLDAQTLLELLETKPERVVQPLKDYLKDIENQISF